MVDIAYTKINNDSDVIHSKADETVTAAAKNRRIKLRLSNHLYLRITTAYEIVATSNERGNLGQHSGNIWKRAIQLDKLGTIYYIVVTMFS